MHVEEQKSKVEPRRIQDDLKGIVRGELYFDDLSRKLYSTDASIFEVEPLGIVAPRDEADVQALVRYAAEHQVSLIPRGAGTGLAGESLGTGLIVDLSCHFRDVLELTDETIRAQPGVTYREINEELARRGRRLGPDTAQPECTLGGMLSTNASGSRAIRYGYVREYVESIRAVLDNGEAVTLGKHPRVHTPAEEPEEGADEDDVFPRLGEIVSSVATLLEQKQDVIRDHRPHTPFNRCGYLLDGVLTFQHVDLARLLVGSEGTLGVITEATLRTVPLPGGRAGLLVSYVGMEAALRAMDVISSFSPVACDLIDRRLLTLARTVRNLSIPPAAEAVLFVELETDDNREAARLVEELVEKLQRREPFPLQVRSASDAEGIAQLWEVREAALPGLYRMRGSVKALPFFEDVAVPPDELRIFIDGAQRMLQQRDVTASFMVHVLTGQVHVRPFLEPPRSADVSNLVQLADDVYRLALGLGGTISGQHGTGIARTPWVAQQYGPLYAVMREIKSIFDPRHVLNPGKIIAQATTRGPWPLRQHERHEAAAVLAHPSADTRFIPRFHWSGSNGGSVASSEIDLIRESESCNGCGTCRTSAADQRMCPIFRADHVEAATPRAKANLMRRMLADGGGVAGISSAEARQVADLCVNCKMCAQECPANVNVPKLMLEAKAANLAERGIDRRDWALARIEGFARIGSALAPLVNRALTHPWSRWLLERLLGISRKRRLPTFAFRSFLQRARKRGWTRRPSEWGRASRLRVAYFVDVFANYNDPTIAEAAVSVLHHNGIEVYVPPGQRGCGMAPLAIGDVETALERIKRNLRIFAELARAGYRIICTEPTAALMWQRDVLDLLGRDHADAKIVAEQTVEWTWFLWDQWQDGRLRTDFQPMPLTIGHHVPCHLKAVQTAPRGPELLSLIPELRVRTIDVSCSGMAGTFGLKASNYHTSLEAGGPMLRELSRPDVLFGSTECSTCKMQMEDGTGKRTLHPAQYLALGHGLMPELWQHLQKQVGKRALS